MEVGFCLGLISCSFWLLGLQPAYECRGMRGAKGFRAGAEVYGENVLVRVLGAVAGTSRGNCFPPQPGPMLEQLGTAGSKGLKR